MKPEWIGGNRYSSDYRFSFSKTLRIVHVNGPLSYGGAWRYRGWSVIVTVLDPNKQVLNIKKVSTRYYKYSTYRQDFEHWGQAFIRATYYRIYKLYHNLRYR